MTDRERAERLEQLLRIVLRILWQEGYTRLTRQVHREMRALGQSEIAGWIGPAKSVRGDR